jgi:hypothetical protein
MNDPQAPWERPGVKFGLGILVLGILAVCVLLGMV